MKKMNVSILWVLLVLPGCSFLVKRKPSPIAKKPETKSVSPKKPTAEVKRPGPASGVPPATFAGPTFGSTAIWQLLTPEKVQITLNNPESLSEIRADLEKGYNQRVLAEGHWQIVKIEVNGFLYSVRPGTSAFGFTVKDNANTYGGTIVIQCPEVGTAHKDDLKKMRFFNRYEFAMNNLRCGMIVGNDFDNVKKALKKDKEFKDLKVTLGF